ncbi:MAG: hypothetical protein JW795_02490 [Chitinivibrionales bacterium]|nr:hypothetical protein [Chitinivibrionales bacterium]
MNRKYCNSSLCVTTSFFPSGIIAFILVLACSYPVSGFYFSVTKTSAALSSLVTLPRSGSESKIQPQRYSIIQSLHNNFQLNDFNAFISVPCMWTWERTRTDGALFKTNEQIWLSDLEFSIGKKITVGFEPRIGCIVPLWYNSTDAWLGANTIKLLLGASLSPSIRFIHNTTSMSADIALCIALTEYESYYHRGSWELTPALRILYLITPRFSSGIELSSFLYHIDWTNDDYSTTASSAKEFGIGILPSIIGTATFNFHYALSFSLGCGPTMAHKPGSSNIRYSTTRFSSSLQLSYTP